MKAIQVPKAGGIEVLTLVEIPVPKAKPNEVVVKIAAAGVNFIDVYFREGRYPVTPPFILGQEAAGVVSEVGSEVKDFKTGERVAFTGITGAYAEYEAVPANRLVPSAGRHHGPSGSRCNAAGNDGAISHAQHLPAQEG